jgi:catechol 2,3-dioxygenase-like lactoylglutathione lyase family enzyme
LRLTFPPHLLTELIFKQACVEVDQIPSGFVHFGSHSIGSDKHTPHMSHLDNPIFFLATANSERSREFYERTLGLAFVADEPPALVFKVADSMLRIQKVERAYTAPYTVLGWAVSDIRQTVDRLDKAGVTFERYDGMNQDDAGIWQAPSGALVAWFRDPDGHVLSLTQFK